MNDILRAPERISVRDWLESQLEPHGDCLDWSGSRDIEGYGRIQIGRRSFRATRVLYELRHGPIGRDQDICHTCDRPPCGKDEHLFPGTSLENQIDMVSKGRGRTGERNGRSLVTADLVREIRGLYKTPTPDGGVWTHLRLARRYKLHQTTISKLVRGETWSHVT